MLQDIIDKLYARFVEVVYANRQKLLTEQEVKTLADGRILTAGEALEAKLIDQVSYLDETIDAMKKALNIEQARVITYVRPKTFKSNIYLNLRNASGGPASHKPHLHKRGGTLRFFQGCSSCISGILEATHLRGRGYGARGARSL